jgi:hypothetical protein
VIVLRIIGAALVIACAGLLVLILAIALSMVGP